MIISADIAVQTLQCNCAHCKQWVKFFFQIKHNWPSIKAFKPHQDYCEEKCIQHFKKLQACMFVIVNVDLRYLKHATL